MTDHELQIRKAALAVFGTELGQWLLDELTKQYARPFNVDPYRTAFNLGAQDTIAFLKELSHED